MVKLGTDFSKLKLDENDLFETTLELLLVAGEEMLYTFKGLGNGVVFTNKRIFTIELPATAGKNKEYSSIPYSSIVRHAVEFVNDVNVDGILTVAVREGNKEGDFKFSFSGPMDLAAISRLISQRIL